MRFGWQEQQLMIREMLERFAADRFPFDWQRGRRTQNDPAPWRELGELGILGLPFDEADGGADGTALDIAVVMEVFGRALVTMPYLSSIVLAGGLLRRLGTPEQKRRHLPALVAGDATMAFGFAEPDSRYNPARVATQASAEHNGFRLSGRKVAVLGAPEADHIIISARTSGDSTDHEGISLFLVPANRVQLKPFVTIDGASAADLLFEDVFIGAEALLGPSGGALAPIESVIDEATVALCADAVGAMAALNAKCVEFTKTRKAFGQQIADFQAIQHRLVDMHVSYEMASAITLKAAQQIAERAPQARRAVAACKALVNEEAAFVGKTAVQMHGAIGITEELDVGHYFKRLTAFQLAFGSSDHQLRRCIEIDNSAGMEA